MPVEMKSKKVFITLKRGIIEDGVSSFQNRPEKFETYQSHPLYINLKTQVPAAESEGGSDPCLDFGGDLSDCFPVSEEGLTPDGCPPDAGRNGETTDEGENLPDMWVYQKERSELSIFLGPKISSVGDPDQEVQPMERSEIVVSLLSPVIPDQREGRRETDNAPETIPIIGNGYSDSGPRFGESYQSEPLYINLKITLDDQEVDTDPYCWESENQFDFPEIDDNLTLVGRPVDAGQRDQATDDIVGEDQDETVSQKERSELEILLLSPIYSGNGSICDTSMGVAKHSEDVDEDWFVNEKYNQSVERSELVISLTDPVAQDDRDGQGGRGGTDNLVERELTSSDGSLQIEPSHDPPPKELIQDNIVSQKTEPVFSCPSGDDMSSVGGEESISNVVPEEVMPEVVNDYIFYVMMASEKSAAAVDPSKMSSSITVDINSSREPKDDQKMNDLSEKFVSNSQHSDKDEQKKVSDQYNHPNLAGNPELVRSQTFYISLQDPSRSSVGGEGRLAKKPKKQDFCVDQMFKSAIPFQEMQMIDYDTIDEGFMTTGRCLPDTDEQSLDDGRAACSAIGGVGDVCDGREVYKEPSEMQAVKPADRSDLLPEEELQGDEDEDIQETRMRDKGTLPPSKLIENQECDGSPGDSYFGFPSKAEYLRHKIKEVVTQSEDEKEQSSLVVELERENVLPVPQGSRIKALVHLLKEGTRQASRPLGDLQRRDDEKIEEERSNDAEEEGYPMEDRVTSRESNITELANTIKDSSVKNDVLYVTLRSPSDNDMVLGTETDQSDKVRGTSVEKDKAENDEQMNVAGELTSSEVEDLCTFVEEDPIMAECRGVDVRSKVYTFHEDVQSMTGKKDGEQNADELSVRPKTRETMQAGPSMEVLPYFHGPRSTKDDSSDDTLLSDVGLWNLLKSLKLVDHPDEDEGKLDTESHRKLREVLEAILLGLNHESTEGAKIPDRIEDGSMVQPSWYLGRKVRETLREESANITEGLKKLRPNLSGMNSKSEGKPEEGWKLKEALRKMQPDWQLTDRMLRGGNEEMSRIRDDWQRFKDDCRSIDASDMKEALSLLTPDFIKLKKLKPSLGGQAKENVEEKLHGLQDMLGKLRPDRQLGSRDWETSQGQMKAFLSELKQTMEDGGQDLLDGMDEDALVHILDNLTPEWTSGGSESEGTRFVGIRNLLKTMKPNLRDDRRRRTHSQRLSPCSGGDWWVTSETQANDDP